MKQMLQAIMQRLMPPKQSFALEKLDHELAKIIRRRRGFFIEAGANDGVSQSNTLYFEKYRGWRGLLVEPIPALAAKCREARPRCFVENCALVPFHFAEKEIALRHCNLMSFVPGAFKTSAEASQHEAAAAECQKLTPVDLHVPARTLTSILDEHRVPQIDFFSLDVEGYELSVLEGLDFDRYAPTYMLVEARYREEVDAFLLPRYEVIAELGYRDVLYRLKSTAKAH
jgi:FkbM family methyltransferase